MNDFLAKYWPVVSGAVAAAWAVFMLALKKFNHLEARVKDLEEKTVTREELDHKLEKLSEEVKEYHKEAQKGNEMTHKRLDQILLKMTDKK